MARCNCGCGGHRSHTRTYSGTRSGTGTSRSPSGPSKTYVTTTCTSSRGRTYPTRSHVVSDRRPTTTYTPTPSGPTTTTYCFPTRTYTRGSPSRTHGATYTHTHTYATPTRTPTTVPYTVSPTRTHTTSRSPSGPGRTRTPTHTHTPPTYTHTPVYTHTHTRGYTTRTHTRTPTHTHTTSRGYTRTPTKTRTTTRTPTNTRSTPRTYTRTYPTHTHSYAREYTVYPTPPPPVATPSPTGTFPTRYRGGTSEERGTRMSTIETIRRTYLWWLPLWLLWLLGVLLLVGLILAIVLPVVIFTRGNGVENGGGTDGGGGGGGGGGTPLSCGELGKSTKPLDGCNTTEIVNVDIRNKSRIKIRLWFIDQEGEIVLVRTIPPGVNYVRRTCEGQRWTLRTLCDDCIGILEATESQVIVFEDEDLEKKCPMNGGKWTSVVDWPRGIVPVALANLPDGGILGFSANAPATNQGGGRGESKTYGAVWNSVSETFRDADLAGHNGFCPGMTFLQDGRLCVIGGGGPQDGYKVSTFDSSKMSWSQAGRTQYRHWYGTAVETGEHRAVLVALGVKLSGTREVDTYFPEVTSQYSFDRDWRSLSNVNLDGKGPNVMNWYPHLHLMPNGRVIMSGPQNDMYVIDPSGDGSITSVGKRNRQKDEREAWGAFTLYYEQSRVLAVGGVEGYGQGGETFNRVSVISVDFSNPSNITTAHRAELTHARSYLNLVALPNGEVIAIGGSRSKEQFSDADSELRPERWNPATNKWTAGEPMDVPRNYHSAAVLTKQGTVIAAGGGLCGDCRVNHPDHQVYHPPYLFNQDGSVAERPALESVPKMVERGQRIKVRVTGSKGGQITRFTLIRHSSVTHSVSTDARILRVARDPQAPRKEVSGTVFEYGLVLESNGNIMPSGYWFLFAVNCDGVPSEGEDLFVR